jgi:3',5'-cyclic AMP phosphodiesterase CpdA
MSISRRTLVRNAGGLALGLGVSRLSRPAEAAPADFSFIHITDTHIQPELGATEGVRQAFEKIRQLKEKPAFALIGGDLVMDANTVSRKRAEMVYDLWQEAASSLNMPVYYTIGNHDAYALGGESKLSSDNPEYGKKWWLKRLSLANRYNSFDHKGWRFVMLDSVSIDEQGGWHGELDADQLLWLDNLLRKTDKNMPMVFLTHIPIMTLFGMYTEGTTKAVSSGLVVSNGKQFQEMIQGRNVKAVFQGHTHVVEECIYLGTRYITGGAVSGDWWKGYRLGVHPEGFTVVRAKGGEISHRYMTYGWKARTV